MAKAERTAKRGIGSRIFGLINPIRDPSLLVGIILTVIEEGGSNATAPTWILFGVLNWVAVKAVIWLLVNFAFSFVYLIRKAGWMIRNPRLAWRLLDALGTEEIIIGGLRPDMFATEDGSLHEGQLGMMGAYAAGALNPGAYAQNGYSQGYGDNGQYDDGYDQGNGYDQGYGRQPTPSMRLDEQSEETRELLTAYAKLITDWMGFTEEKWRAVSDSQLGWKPLRGRWNGWEEIYRDAYNADDDQANGDAMARRFDNSQAKGSAASSVACFLRDLEALRTSLLYLEGGDGAQQPPQRMAGARPAPAVSTRTNKSPIIRSPMIVDADR
ncbi:MAG TPA: hypothetical protein VGR88_02285 [Ktedonobacterales bacterium]|nr:hypothetical protein [Ktedonobacterales bacterium]